MGKRGTVYLRDVPGPGPHGLCRAELRPDPDDPLVYGLYIGGEKRGGEVWRNSPGSNRWFTQPCDGTYTTLLEAGEAILDIYLVDPRQRPVGTNK